jgi:hypothetical protein
LCIDAMHLVAFSADSPQGDFHYRHSNNSKTQTPQAISEFEPHSGHIA